MPRARFTWKRALVRSARPVFWALAVLVGVWIASSSWMKWFDLTIDAGREAYLPWRILEGEHLGRDFLHPYGPLSAYANAGLFGLFGVGLTTLAWANLTIYAVITFLAYRLVRRAHGFLPAAVATFFGITVFGFGHHLYAANYTYAAPYSHEATHGMLLFLLLLTWCGRAPTRRGVVPGLLGGVLTGLLWLTKTEYVVASGLVVAATFVRMARAPLTGIHWRTSAVGAAVGAAGVLFAAWLCLLAPLGPALAARVATNAIFAPLHFAAYSQSAHVLSFVGADRPWQNIGQVLLWGTGTAAAVAALLRGLPRRSLVLAAGLGLLVGGAVAAWALRFHGWERAGRSLPVLVGAAFAIVVATRSGPAPFRSSRGWHQFLLLLAAGAMLLRMALAPKLHHYGFFQAYLAGLAVVAWLTSEAPRRFAPTLAVSRGVGFAGMIAVAGVALSALQHSSWIYSRRNTPFGEGRDRCFAYDPGFYPLTDGFEQARKLIQSGTQPQHTLLVVPEGINLNYHTRRKHPLRIMDLLPATLRLNPGDVVTELKAKAPDVVVLITRDNMPELGVPYYGYDSSSGAPLLQWVIENYQLVAQGGDPPFAPGKFGVQIWKRR